MLHKKKGFTLIEVIVVMLVATLVFTMVGGTMVFITTTTGDLIHQAEEIDMAKNIAKYLRANFTFEENIDDPDYIINDPDYITKIDVFSDVSLKEFKIYLKGNFIKCSMTFESNRNFEFIIGAVQ